MHPRTDLTLLLDNLTQLSLTPYFDKAIEKHTLTLIDVIQHALTASPPYDEEIVRRLATHVWATHRYMHGSTTRESPYEIAYCMKVAATDWRQDPCLMMTALTEDKDFHLLPIDPWHFVRTAIADYSKPLPGEQIICLGVPRVYKHMPLFCAPLYHELGHFVDHTYGVTETAWLQSGREQKHKKLICNHYAEIFADVFAASHIGSAIVHSLDAIGPNLLDSDTHPATQKRIEIIKKFLASEQCDQVDFLQNALETLGLPKLQIRYELPNIEEAFDDLRPYTIASPPELHGIIAAGWSYLTKARHGQGPKWSVGADPSEIVRIVNDLVGKSIRNASIKAMWAGKPL